MTGCACSTCGERHNRKGQRLCATCHAAYMRDWRKTHPLSDEARKRDRARSHANVGKRRGQLIPEHCKICGSEKTQMHHPDHERPRDVVWLCRPCHLAWHAYWRDCVLEAWNAWVSKTKRSEAA